MNRLHYLLFITILFGWGTSGYAQAKKSENEKSKKMNILFIAVDDLRLQAGMYGEPQMKTPSIDKLGESGRVFNRTYCSVPVCGASRASLLSGIYPTAKRFVDYNTRKDKDAPEVTSLPLHFKNNGYTTLARGKIYHHYDDDSQAWSEKPYHPLFSHDGIGWQCYLTDESKEIVEENRNPSNPNEVKGPAYEAADVPDNSYPDGMVTDKVLEDLEKFSQSEEPFFLAVGFWKPHLPFNAPKKYWDLYDKNDIILADNPFPPKNAPAQAMHDWGELRRMYAGIPQEGPVSDELARELIHGYYACVSYTDAQIGKILNELDRLGLAENTIVVLWGDHGWHLGEHTLWVKHCNFDKVMNAPLLVRAPGIETRDNNHSNSLIEFIDIYPTLCDLADLEKPGHLDGKSFVKVLKDPDASIHKAVYSRYFGGETLVTQRYAYTEWTENGEMKANMLYDHKYDRDENINVVYDPDYKDVANEMKQLLNQKREKIAEKK